MERFELGRGAADLTTQTGTLRVRYVLERSRRARRLRLVLDEGDLVRLRLPWHVDPEEALSFLHSHADWIRAAWERRPPRRTLEEHLAVQPELTLEGTSWTVVRRPWPLWRARRVRSGRVVELVGPGHEDPEVPLAGLLRALATEDLPQRAHRLAQRAGLALDGVTVRDQATRWGSCSSRRRLSLNWRLILLPPALQDHVLWHELAHLTHLHHRPSFWRKLAQYDPHWEIHDRQLSAISMRIMGLGRGAMPGEEDDEPEEVACDV